ncbi:MAG: hypothetical protein FJ295_07125 [Planctomycetes bacterium]|nr:hypothetical protein [Planctomycetota bacterium]
MKMSAGVIRATIAFLCAANVAFGQTGSAERRDPGPFLGKINAVGPHGEGHRDAAAAWQVLSKLDAAQLPAVLAGMRSQNLLAENWIRAAVEAIAERQERAGRTLPQKELEQFLAQVQHAPRARRLAYELILRADPAAEKRLLDGLIDDPSLELRRDAVMAAFHAAEALENADKKDAARDAYKSAFRSARDVDQIKLFADKLRKLEASVDLPSHFGFLMNWHVVGPFENRGDVGYQQAYPPESKVELKESYAGQDHTKIAWAGHTTQDDFGLVDLNKLLGNHKGAVAYAFHEFAATEPRTVDIRIGSTNANKVWLNGELLTANHVYHAGRDIDQYVAKGKLKAGANQILVKILQNEQTEPWAQDWQFQLRVCDAIGTPVFSSDRKPATTTSGGS